uniref:X-box-binding protein 1 n=1 Tax=Anopheles dirus TaxID=7168 RepID=A0A182NPI0_9DIPT
MATPIFITVPTKYIPINVAPAATVVAKPSAIKPLVAKRPSPPPSSVASDEEESSSMDEFIVRGAGKKRRLDHLTWEEKIQRKKLKNRVAAQTSRDRKKAKMEEMESTIQEQSEQIEQLQHRCAALDTEKNAIYDKYLNLERRFEDLQKRLEAQEQKVKEEPQEEMENGGETTTTTAATNAGGSVGCVTAGRTTTGSAASPRCPQQQGLYKCGPAEAQTTLPPAPVANDPRLAALWRIIALCLLYRTCSKISTCPSSSSLPRACSPVSTQTWRSLITQAARLMPKATAPASACLDQWWGPQQNSWNPGESRLILTTHNYCKSPFNEKQEQQEEQMEGDEEAEQKPTVTLPGDTLYGTYDNETNCITIVLRGDEEMMVEETEVSETTVTTNTSDEDQVLLFDQLDQAPMEEAITTSSAPLAPITIRPPSPLQDLLSSLAPAPSHQPLKSPGGYSSMSDAGYESLGSPVAPTLSLDYALGDDFSEFWNLDPLFPILE